MRIIDVIPRGVVRAVVAKITIGVECIAMQLSKSALRALLLPAATANNTAHEPEDDLIELNVEARLKRCGRTVRLIVTPAEAGPAESNDQQQLIHTLAQAQLSLEQLQSGEVSSLRMVANCAGLSERYASRIMRCAFLAPDLVEAILQGRHWPGLTLRNLTEHLPLDWSEQRRAFGFVADKAGIAC